MKKWVPVSALLAAALGVFWLRSSAGQRSLPQSVPKSLVEATAVAAELESEKAPAQKPLDLTSQASSEVSHSAHRTEQIIEHRLSAEEEKQWLSQLPSKAQLRAESARNPHQPPASLLQLGSVFAQMMTLAGQSADQAQTVFQKFAVCAADTAGSFTTSLKAICFNNAKRVAEKNGGALGVELTGLKSRLDHPTEMLVNSYNKL